MKRDMELVRQILIEIEKQPYAIDWIDLDLPGYTSEQVSEHVRLLAGADLIEAVDLSSESGSEWRPKGLKWQGHDFLEASRNETVWRKAKEIIKNKGGGMTLDILKQLLTKLLSEQVLS